MKIMFVCTGNTCRSAMAEGLAKKYIKENNIKDVELYSAGIYALDGEHASYNSIAVMKEFDVDIVLHKATSIEKSNIEDMDLILCATRKHKQELQYRYDNLKDKIYTLKEYAKYENYETDGDIKDPWGSDLNTYRICAAEISLCIEKIFEKLK